MIIGGILGGACGRVSVQAGRVQILDQTSAFFYSESRTILAGCHYRTMSYSSLPVCYHHLYCKPN